jgi:hypothetical protein
LLAVPKAPSAKIADCLAWFYVRSSCFIHEGDAQAVGGLDLEAFAGAQKQRIARSSSPASPSSPEVDGTPETQNTYEHNDCVPAEEIEWHAKR